MRNMLALVLTLMVFLGNIGLPVYSHSCSTAGTTYRTIGVHTGACKVHEKKVEKIAPCCHKPKTVEKRSCCSESVKRLALSFHYIHFLDESPGILPPEKVEPVFEEAASKAIFAESTGLQTNRPPPWIPVNRYLSAICVWRI